MTVTDPEAHARRTDPDTSHHAAATLPDMNARQAAVLRVFTTLAQADLADGLTHPQLIHWYRKAQKSRPDEYPAQTDQSIRSRCSELVRRGVVEDTGTRLPTDSGRSQVVWALTGLWHR